MQPPKKSGRGIPDPGPGFKIRDPDLCLPPSDRPDYPFEGNGLDRLYFRTAKLDIDALRALAEEAMSHHKPARK